MPSLGIRARTQPDEVSGCGALPDILEWSRRFEPATKEWLILGKGPSYELIHRLDVQPFFVCALNHVVRERPVDLAHVIDIDVVEDCAEQLEHNARYVVMPFYPHRKNHPTRRTLMDFADSIPVLASLRAKRRLVGYNLSTAAKQVGDSPVIESRCFSAEAVVDILGTCGVRRVRTLGVDGGSDYALTYRDLRGRTLLANRQRSFDAQFAGIAKAARRHGIFYAPLHKEAPIRVFVDIEDIEDAAGLPFRILDYSLRRQSSLSVEVIPLPGSEPSWLKVLRIPALCGFRGRAIYLKAPMVVCGDIAEVWDLPMPGLDFVHAEAPGWRGPARRHDILLIQCERLRGTWSAEVRAPVSPGEAVLPPGATAPGIPWEWSGRDSWMRGRSRLIRFDRRSGNPWASGWTFGARHWRRLLRLTLAEGLVQPDEVSAEVAAGRMPGTLPRRAGLARTTSGRHASGEQIARAK
jgi:hypothetical protein